jgi:hypothetical protein
MIEFVIFFCKVNSLFLGGSSPPAQSLIQLEHGDVTEIWHPCNRLQCIKSKERFVEIREIQTRHDKKV